MPVFNAATFLRSTIDSILNQSYPHFELIIADDASTDDSVAIIESYQDVRIKLIKNEIHQGISACLNQIIQVANSNFFARMDADDIMFPQRIETQTNYLVQNPHIDLLGSQAVVINHNNQILGLRVGKNNTDILDLFLGSTFIHPSIMGKTEWFKNHLYDESFDGAEDYELFIRASNESVYNNLETPLIFYREQFNLSVYSRRLKVVRKAVNKNQNKISDKLFKRKLLTFIQFKCIFIRILVNLGLEQVVLGKRNNKLSSNFVGIYKNLLEQSSK